MPKIDLSDRVLDLIRSLRAAGETTEDQTLARILAAVADDRDARLRAYERAEQDIQSTN